MNKCNIIPIFVPHLGCPHDCIFCNQRKITSFNDSLDKEQICLTIEKYISYFKNKEIPIEIAFYGGSFTGLNENLMIEYLKIAKKYIDQKLVDSVRLSTRPDYIDEHILDILLSYKVKTIELGIQSLSSKVLDLNERGHDVDCVYKSSSLIKKYKINLGLQMMTGLFGDDFNSCIHTALDIAYINPDFVRVYPTLIIKDTKLEQLYYSKKYIPMDIKDAIRLCKYIDIIFEYHNIDIIRLGLQSSDNISKDKDVVAGPYHPSFREFVQSDIYFDLFKYYIKKFKIKKYLHFECSNEEISKIVGNKKSNINRMKEKFNLDISFSIHNFEKNILIINENLVNRKEFIDYSFMKILRRFDET